MFTFLRGVPRTRERTVSNKTPPLSSNRNSCNAKYLLLLWTRKCTIINEQFVAVFISMNITLLRVE